MLSTHYTLATCTGPGTPSGVERFASKSNSAVGAYRTVTDVDGDTTTVNVLPLPPSIAIATPPIQELGGNPGLPDPDHIRHPPPVVGRSQVPIHQGVPRREDIVQPRLPHVFIPTYGFPLLISAGSSFEFDFTIKRFYDPLPSLMSQYWTARGTVGKLQAEKQILQLQLWSLQHHLSLHKSHIKFTHEAKETKRRTDACHENLHLLDEHHKVLINSHLASVHGSHAGEYQTLLAEHLQLEDQFRQIAASHMVTHYSLQKLIIDVTHTHSKTTLQMLVSATPECSDSPSTNLTNPVHGSSIRPSGIVSFDSVNSIEGTITEQVNIPRTGPFTSVRPLSQVVPQVPMISSTIQIYHAVDDVFHRTGAQVSELANDVPHLSPLYQLHLNLAVQMGNSVVQNRDTAPPVPGSSACLNPQWHPMPTVDPVPGVTSTTASSRFSDFMSHVLDVLPPPNLCYPPDERDLDRSILTWETSYERTKLPEDDPTTKLQDLNGEMTSFLVIVDRFIPEKDGRRICTMCRYVEVVEVPSVVGLDDLQVLLDHLKRAHPRCWGKQLVGPRSQFIKASLVERTSCNPACPIFPLLISAGSSFEFDFTIKRFYDPLPSLMSQYWTARGTVGKLQAEKQILQLQLWSLQHHLSLHKSHIKFTHEAKETKRRTDACHENLHLLDEHHKVLINSHLASVHGSHAGEYQTLLAEHLQLEDQFRQIAASHMVTHYSLQKLIIDVTHTHSKTTLQMLVSATPECSDSPSTNLTNPVHGSSIRPSGIVSFDSVNSIEGTITEQVNIPRTGPFTSVRPLSQVVPQVPMISSTIQIYHAVDDVFHRTGAQVSELANDVPHLSPLYQLHLNLAVQMGNSVVQNRDTAPPVPGSSACLNPQWHPMPTVDPVPGVTSTTASSRFSDFMSHVLDVLPPPNLCYPPDERDLDRSILTWETSYERTKLPEDDPTTKLQDLNREMTSFLVIVDRFIPEKDGRRICTMCRYVEVVEVPSVVGLDDLQVLLDHLKRAHPRCWGKQLVGRV
ncbi:hypothetical protein BDM02DRAFT_3182829 [Thelephora ganbajun]|uniref:Uncharacterized protein n=1 Tax=Thelephora ganbajun TaxID=370292 RepID=A0ACB6ZVE5_THEGA|nr:hypothetical protein BDM02DRAFT_3182829 [Thelephora ganbajun]